MIEFDDFNLNITCNYEFSEENTNFVDFNVKFFSGELESFWYVKPKIRRQYLHFQSSHHKHKKRLMAYSQTLRASKLHSEEEYCKNHCNKMKSWFLKCTYPEHLHDTEIKKVRSTSKE